MTKTLLKSAFVIGVVTAAAGCASNSDATQSQIDQAMRKTESAQTTANEAQRTANRAMQTAQEAKSASQANSQRIERMFESSQRK